MGGQHHFFVLGAISVVIGRAGQLHISDTGSSTDQIIAEAALQGFSKAEIGRRLWPPPPTTPPPPDEFTILGVTSPVDEDTLKQISGAAFGVFVMLGFVPCWICYCCMEWRRARSNADDVNQGVFKNCNHKNNIIVFNTQPAGCMTCWWGRCQCLAQCFGDVIPCFPMFFNCAVWNSFFNKNRQKKKCLRCGQEWDLWDVVEPGSNTEPKQETMGLAECEHENNIIPWVTEEAHHGMNRFLYWGQACCSWIDACDCEECFHAETKDFEQAFKDGTLELGAAERQDDRCLFAGRFKRTLPGRQGCDAIKVCVKCKQSWPYRERLRTPQSPETCDHVNLIVQELSDKGDSWTTPCCFTRRLTDLVQQRSRNSTDCNERCAGQLWRKRCLGCNQEWHLHEVVRENLNASEATPDQVGLPSPLALTEALHESSDVQKVRPKKEDTLCVLADNLSAGWEKAWSKVHRRSFYFNRETGEKQWRKPQVDEVSTFLPGMIEDAHPDDLN
jgi:hypothetical protein